MDLHSDAVAARESARAADGTFGTQTRTSPGDGGGPLVSPLAADEGDLASRRIQRILRLHAEHGLPDLHGRRATDGVEMLATSVAGTFNAPPTGTGSVFVTGREEFVSNVIELGIVVEDRGDGEVTTLARTMNVDKLIAERHGETQERTAFVVATSVQHRLVRLQNEAVSLGMPNDLADGGITDYDQSVLQQCHDPDAVRHLATLQRVSARLRTVHPQAVTLVADDDQLGALLGRDGDLLEVDPAIDLDLKDPLTDDPFDPRHPIMAGYTSTDPDGRTRVDLWRAARLTPARIEEILTA